MRFFALALLLFLLILPVSAQTEGFHDATPLSVDDADPEKLLELYLKEAEKGLPRAQFEAADLLYRLGRGDTVKLSQAAAWYKKAAESGEPLSQYHLGKMYLNGEGMPVDYQVALFWITLAGKTSLEVLVQRELAAATRGLPATDVVAVRKRVNDWRISPDNLKKLVTLADSAYTSVQCHLGDLYRYGNGVPQDFAEAMKWYNLAAAHDSGMAQHQLYEMYFNGIGVKQSYEEAYFWLRISQRHSKLVKDRDPILEGHPLAKLLSFGQVGRVNERVEVWKPVHPLPKP